MACYYFDVTDDQGSFTDIEDIHFATIEGAKAEAVQQRGATAFSTQVRRLGYGRTGHLRMGTKRGNRR